MSVKDIDLGWNNFVAQAKFWQDHEVVIGWIEGGKPRKHGEVINNATLATIHEFGTSDGHIPAGRLGLREFVDRKQNEIAGWITEAYKESIPRGNAKRELNKLGLRATAGWKKYLRDVQPGPPLAGGFDVSDVESEIVNKGVKKKLIDTGQLINGITHAVRRRTS